MHLNTVSVYCVAEKLVLCSCTFRKLRFIVDINSRRVERVKKSNTIRTCVVPENIHTPPPIGGVTGNSGGWGSRGRNFQRVWGKKSNIFPGASRTLSKGNLPITHLRFGRSSQQIHELQYISLYSNAIRTFSAHF